MQSCMWARWPASLGLRRGCRPHPPLALQELVVHGSSVPPLQSPADGVCCWYPWIAGRAWRRPALWLSQQTVGVLACQPIDTREALDAVAPRLARFGLGFLLVSGSLATAHLPWQCWPGWGGEGPAWAKADMEGKRWVYASALGYQWRGPQVGRARSGVLGIARKGLGSRWGRHFPWQMAYCW